MRGKYTHYLLKGNGLRKCFLYFKWWVLQARPNQPQHGTQWMKAIPLGLAHMVSIIRNTWFILYFDGLHIQIFIFSFSSISFPTTLVKLHTASLPPPPTLSIRKATPFRLRARRVLPSRTVTFPLQPSSERARAVSMCVCVHVTVWGMNE